MGHHGRIHLNRLIQQLEVGPAWLHTEPPCALWLDSHRRVNVCTIDDYAVGTPLVRLSLNRRPLHTFKDRAGWPERSEYSPASPNWRLELICLPDEAGAFVQWLAGVVNRREGYQKRIPDPPHPLLNWDDLNRLDDYIYYLSEVTFWTERAFHEDIKWSRHTVPAHATLVPAT